MPLIRTFVKLGPREVIIKWVGSGIDTINLNDLVSTNQTVSGTFPPSVDILAVHGSVTNNGEFTVIRNNVAVVNGFANFHLPLSSHSGFVLNENSGSSIAVNLSSNGTLILTLKKMQGYTGI